MIGVGIGVTALSCMYWVGDWGYIMLGVAIGVGISQSIMLSTAVNLISDFVGNRNDGSVVFGIYSFLDKISVGICIYLIGNSPSLIE